MLSKNNQFQQNQNTQFHKKNNIKVEISKKLIYLLN